MRQHRVNGAFNVILHDPLAAYGKYLILLIGEIPPKMDHVSYWNINWAQLKDEVIYVKNRARGKRVLLERRSNQ